MTLSSSERTYICLCCQGIITSIQFKDDSKLVLCPAGLGLLFLVHPYSQRSDFPRVVTQDSQPKHILICNPYLSCLTPQPPSLELAKISGGKVQMLSFSAGPHSPLESSQVILHYLKADIFYIFTSFSHCLQQMISLNYLVHHY